MIIVPRHPERFELVASAVTKAGFSLARRSLSESPAAAQVYLGDTMGELMMLYGASDLAFIGGSLIERGGHNPLEPAAWGIAVISGPHVFNFESIYQCLQEHDGVTIVESAGALLVCLTRLLNNQQALHESGQRALAVVESNRGALGRVVAGISQRV